MRFMGIQWIQWDMAKLVTLVGFQKTAKFIAFFSLNLIQTHISSWEAGVLT